jgi:hypothetical protein
MAATYSTPPLWSIAAAQDATYRHEFIYLHREGYATRITIQDAMNLWGVDPSIGFHTGYRISGPPDLVISNLTIQLPPGEIAPILATMVTLNNYATEMIEVYQEEQNAYTTWSRNIILSQKGIPARLTLFNLAQQYNPAIGINAVTNPPAKRGGKIKDLAEAVRHVLPGKVIDVTKFHAGTGYRTVKFPKNMGKYYYATTLPIMSENLTSYLAAISALPGGYMAHLNEIGAVNQQNINISHLRNQIPVDIFQALNLPNPQTNAQGYPQTNAQGYPQAPIGFVVTPTVQNSAFPVSYEYYPTPEWKKKK